MVTSIFRYGGGEDLKHNDMPSHTIQSGLAVSDSQCDQVLMPHQRPPYWRVSYHMC